MEISGKSEGQIIIKKDKSAQQFCQPKLYPKRGPYQRIRQPNLFLSPPFKKISKTSKAIPHLHFHPNQTWESFSRSAPTIKKYRPFCCNA